MESGSDVEINTKVQEIIQNIQLAMEKLRKSSFYTEFMKQMENPEMIALIERVIGTDPRHSQLRVVLYCVGRMEPTEVVRDVERNHMQLCLAILLRENFNWVHNIVVYDPVLSTMERKAIKAFDCICFSVNYEDGIRKVNRPTLFFLPRCDIRLTDRVLEANWTPENLNKIIILGNRFKRYDLDKNKFAYHYPAKKIQIIIDSDHMLHEIRLPHTATAWDGDIVYERSFHGFSWNFFDWDGSLHGFQRQDPEMSAPKA